VTPLFRPGASFIKYPAMSGIVTIERCRERHNNLKRE
jgi:hypothetical protein